MIERLTAQTQARLSYLIVLGYFALKVMEGLDVIKPVTGASEIVMAVVFFWFQRQRQPSTNGDSNEVRS